jgi:hypothetical protein
MSDNKIASVVKPTWRQLKEFIDALPEKYLDAPIVWWGIEEAGRVDEVITLGEKNIWTPEGYVAESEFDNDGDFSIEAIGDTNKVLEAGFPIIWIEKPIDIPVAKKKVYQIKFHGETFHVSADTEQQAKETLFNERGLPRNEFDESFESIVDVPQSEWVNIIFTQEDRLKGMPDKDDISVADYMQVFGHKSEVICHTSED